MTGGKMDSFEKRGEGEKSEPQGKTTIFYRPFSKKEHQEERGRLQSEEQVQQLRDEQVKMELERSLEEEVIRQRFAEIAPLLKNVRVQTEVDVSGERHILTFESITKNTTTVENVDTYAKEVKDGRESLDGVDARFRLDWTYGRGEPLYLDFTVPIKTLLRGGGGVERQLENLMTGQFAGTHEYYQELMEEGEGEEPMDPVRFKEDKEQIMESVLSFDAEVFTVENEQLFSVIITPRDEDRQIIVSSTDKRTWNVAEKVDQKIIKDTTNLRPQEVLSVIEKTL